MSRAGYVLVGGRSSRMGCDKALLPFRGSPLAVAVARAVEEGAGTVALIGDPGRYGGLGIPVIPDRYPGEGPLGGILTALEQTSADWNLVAACDMPQLSGGFLSGLFAAAEESAADILVPQNPGGRLEPLCSVYHRASLEGLAAAWERGIRKVAAAWEGLRAVAYPVREVAQFQNLNTPEDWAGYVPK